MSAPRDFNTFLAELAPGPTHQEYDDDPPRRYIPKCDLCGRFAKGVRIIYGGEYDSEPLYAAGSCCK